MSRDRSEQIRKTAERAYNEGYKNGRRDERKIWEGAFYVDPPFADYGMRDSTTPSFKDPKKPQPPDPDKK